MNILYIFVQERMNRMAKIIVREIDGKRVTIALTSEEMKSVHQLVVREKISDYIQEITGDDWGFDLSEEEKEAMLPKVVDKMAEVLEDYIRTSDLRFDAMCAAFDYYDIDREEQK